VKQFNQSPGPRDGQRIVSHGNQKTGCTQSGPSDVGLRPSLFHFLWALLRIYSRVGVRRDQYDTLMRAGISIQAHDIPLKMLCYFKAALLKLFSSGDHFFRPECSTDHPTLARFEGKLFEILNLVSDTQFTLI
jgi:hypothetical protein